MDSEVEGVRESGTSEAHLVDEDIVEDISKF